MLTHLQNLLFEHKMQFSENLQNKKVLFKIFKYIFYSI